MMAKHTNNLDAKDSIADLAYNKSNNIKGKTRQNI